MGPENISPKEILRILEKAAGKEAVPVANLEEFERRIEPCGQKGEIILGRYNRDGETLSAVLKRSFHHDAVDAQFYVEEQVLLKWLSKFIPPEKVQKLSSNWQQGDTFHARFEELIKDSLEIK